MKITTNGIVKLDNGIKGSNGAVSAVMISGVFGAAVLTLGYYDEFSSFIPFTDGLISGTDTQYSISHGIGVRPMLEVVSADGTTNISVVVTGAI